MTGHNESWTNRYPWSSVQSRSHLQTLDHQLRDVVHLNAHLETKLLSFRTCIVSLDMNGKFNGRLNGILMEIHGYQWILMDINGDCLILMDININAY